MSRTPLLGHRSQLFYWGVLGRIDPECQYKFVDFMSFLYDMRVRQTTPPGKPRFPGQGPCQVLAIYNSTTFSLVAAAGVSVAAQADDSGFGDRLDLADFVEDGILCRAIDAH
jgi:hypothetical protein